MPGLAELRMCPSKARYGLFIHPGGDQDELRN